MFCRQRESPSTSTRRLRHTGFVKGSDSANSTRPGWTCATRPFDLDEKTARNWREAYDHGSLSLSVWFRPVKVQKATWKNHPRFNNGTQTHDIAIEVEVLRFEAKLDTPAAKDQPGSVPPKKPVNPGDRDPFDDRQ